MSPTNTNPMLSYLSARENVLRLYRGNQVKLDKDVVTLSKSDRFMLAFYYARRNNNQNMVIQLYTAIMNDLIAEKEAKNAVTK